MIEDELPDAKAPPSSLTGAVNLEDSLALMHGDGSCSSSRHRKRKKDRRKHKKDKNKQQAAREADAHRQGRPLPWFVKRRMQARAKKEAAKSKGGGR